MGGSGRSKGESIEALEEAVQIIHAFWSGTRALHFEGKHYTVKGAHPGPRPAHSIGIWLGSYGPRSLGVLGRLANGWLPSSSYAPPERLPEMQQRIDDSALKAGRQPREIRRLYNIMGLITDGPVQRCIYWSCGISGLMSLHAWLSRLAWIPSSTGPRTIACARSSFLQLKSYQL